MILRFSLLLWAVILAGPALGGDATPPRVVVSMPPIHSLIAGVMKGIASPELLVRGGASPHNTHLRPSQIRSLGRAEVIFWLGGEAEPFLKRPLENLSGRRRIVAILELPGLLRLPLRSGGVWTDHEHPPGEAAATPGPPPEATDPHVWLDPFNAGIIAQAAADLLGEVDPERAERYQENARRLRFRLDNLHLEIGDVAVAAINKPYIVFHDAYQYFEHRYHLRAAGAVTLDPGRRPGARRLREIRRLLRESHAHCIFSEPQFPSPLLKMLTDDGQYYTGRLDPVGTGIPPGPEMYFILMRRLVSDLVGCLCQVYADEELETETPPAPAPQ